MADRASPAALGFSMPAEWEPHAATWIGWPHNASDWPGKLAAIQWVYGEIVRKLAPGETVRILVQSGEHERQARRVLERTGVDRARVEFLRLPTNRGWTRDFGPMFVRRVRPPAEIAIVRFRFNAWAKYPDWKKDDQVPERVARRRKLRLFPAQCAGRDVVLEGGSIDLNGRGTLLTTEECLLDREVQARNPGLSRADLEAALRDSLGVTNVLWLGKGIAGDDTHGHVDDVCRFVDPRTVVLCRELRRPATPRELRELLRGQCGGARAHVQRPERPLRPGRVGGAVHGPGGRGNPRRRSRVGIGHDTLFDTAGAGGEDARCKS